MIWLHKSIADQVSKKANLDQKISSFKENDFVFSE